MTVEEFFSGQAKSRQIFEVVRSAVEAIGPAELRVQKSQISFRRRRPFAWLWMPGQYLGGKTAPLVLSIAFRNRTASPRWKEVVEPLPGRFMHHLELHSPSDIDKEVCTWLQEAWLAATETDR
ncbi:MAG: hypothetical protein JXB85_16475 [Anaerolineales bacterium]|nr:hypothetical protein [Anaerolineales bacterium]